MAKKMTKAQKAQNAKVKQKLQEEGILPPDKPRMNRKKYIEEAVAEWDGRERDYYGWELYLHRAIVIMLGQTDQYLRTSPEAVGVAKTLKLAIRLKEFSNKLKEEGRCNYTLSEQYEYIKDILNA